MANVPSDDDNRTSNYDNRTSTSSGSSFGLRFFALGTVVLALLFLVLFGIVGLGREGAMGFDGRVLYAAGRAWLGKANPYDHVALVQSVSQLPDMDLYGSDFFYPPQAAGLVIPLGLVSYSSARVIWVVFQLIGVSAIVLATRALLRSRSGGNHDAWGGLVLSAVAIGNPFTAHVVWMGQTSIVAFAAIMGAWTLAQRKNWLGAGLCFGLASFKPQICILVGLWFLLEQDWKTLLVAFGTMLLLALYPIATQGPIGAFTAWRTGVSSGYALPFNLATFPHKVGMESLLSAAVVVIPGAVFLTVSVLATATLWIFRSSSHPADRLGLLMAITFTFSGYLHDYDYVGLVPVFVSLWSIARQRTITTFAAAALPVLLFVPQRFLRALNVPVVNQWRTVVVIAMAVAVLVLGMRAVARGHKEESKELAA